MRIAVRADETTDATQQETGGARGHLVSTLEAVVSTTEDRMDERAKDVENVIKAAAEPDSGEFMVPLLPERVAAMRSALQVLDETALDTVFLNVRLMRDDEESRRWNGFNGGHFEGAANALEHPLCGRKVGQQEQGIIVGSLQTV
jgi:hypothetical protein